MFDQTAKVFMFLKLFKTAKSAKVEGFALWLFPRVSLLV